MRHPATRIRFVAAFAGVLAAAAVFAGLGTGKSNLPHGSARLDLQLVPGTVTAGQQALAIATLKNISHDPLTNTVVSFVLPSTLSYVSAPGCTSNNGTRTVVNCAIGDVASGKTVTVKAITRASHALTSGQAVKIIVALRVGPGVARPIFSSFAASALVSSDASNRGSCTKVPQTLTATLNNQTTSIVAPSAADPSLALPCTPLAAGVGPVPTTGGYKTGSATVELPKLAHPAIVKLTFKDETLPDENMIDNLPAGAHPSFHNPNPLWVVDEANPDIRYVVPRCKPGPTFPPGWRSCIVSVLAIDPDQYHDFDAGTITLLVQGKGFGDPRFNG
jgi:uncharacterized repeat protein (TIGR01451 family)